MKKLLMVAMLLIVAACDRGDRGMETKTYELHRLSTDEAFALLTPYIRERGRLSGKGKLITVREKPDRLTVIEELLRKYDGDENAVDVVLHVQVVEANGFTQRDSAIADIEPTLRQTFRYSGYRLAGEAHIQAREGSTFSRSIGRGFVMGQNQPGGYALMGRVDRLSTSQREQRVPVEIQLRGPNQDGFVEVSGTITGTIGKPTVIGQSTGNGAIILVIRPSLAK
jgi:hypothetical protein